MKFTLILACLVLYVAVIEAQQRRCLGEYRPTPLRPRSCTAAINAGDSRNPGCNRNANRNMWAYSPRQRRCIKLTYLGCGGNGNRYCSQRDCNARCPRRN